MAKFVRVAGAGTLAVGSFAGNVLPADATPAVPQSPARASAPAGTTSTATAAAPTYSAQCANQNPSDVQIIYQNTITGGEDGSYGTVYLEYSPSTRCIRAAATLDGGPCGSSQCGHVDTVLRSNGSHDAVAQISPTATNIKTVWINDANVQHKAAATVGDGYGYTGWY